jgi:hypothetical protein
MEGKCKDCKWWDYIKGNNAICRKNAPSPQILKVLKSEKNVTYTLCWPSPEMNEWCGGFEPETSSNPES